MLAYTFPQVLLRRGSSPERTTTPRWNASLKHSRARHVRRLRPSTSSDLVFSHKISVQIPDSARRQQQLLSFAGGGYFLRYSSILLSVAKVNNVECCYGLFGDIWLIAFIVYLGLCLLIEAVYPVRVRKKYALKTEHAKWFWSYKHFFLYLWAWIVNASLFMLFWEFNEILRPIALSLPFLMVYAAARIGRRNYRIFHGASPDDRAVGMPKIYSATLGKLSKPLRTTGHQSGLTLDHDLSTTALISGLIFFASTALFLLRLTDIDFEYAPPVPL